MADEFDGLTEFNGLDAAAARDRLLTCCSSPLWAEQVAAGRPYSTPDDLVAAASAALAEIPDSEIDAALAGHPRIGERAASTPAVGSDSVVNHAQSAREQSGVDHDDTATIQALADGNRAYEERFGHVYLVFASGRTAAELLALLRQRLTNDPVAERAVLRAELGRINALRLRRMATGE